MSGARRSIRARRWLANRHGLTTGATGTGKTITLQVPAERFSRIGVPYVLADVKGDLAGLAAAGTASPKLTERLATLKIPAPAFAASPVAFWDVFGKSGHPMRATASDMGPLLLGRLLQLNDTQRGVLSLIFKVADDAGMLLLDAKDLRRGRARRMPRMRAGDRLAALIHGVGRARPSHASDRRASDAASLRGPS
jgi:DNA helicase HerA-like ATPase